MDSLRDIKIEPSAADENSLALENSAAEKNSVLENSDADGSSQFTSILDSFDSDSTDSESENTDNSVNPLESESSHEERLNVNTEGLQSAQTNAVIGSVENNYKLIIVLLNSQFNEIFVFKYFHTKISKTRTGWRK